MLSWGSLKVVSFQDCVLLTKILSYHMSSLWGHQPENIKSLGNLSASYTFWGPQLTVYKMRVGFNPQGLLKPKINLFYLLSLPHSALWWRCYRSYKIKVSKLVTLRKPEEVRLPFSSTTVFL